MAGSPLENLDRGTYGMKSDDDGGLAGLASRSGPDGGYNMNKGLTCRSLLVR